MTRQLCALALLLAAACGEPEAGSVQTISKNPVSVRGWILDVKGAQTQQNPDLEIARRTELFAGASIWVENTQYASGGIQENGAFVVLDVPPQNATIGFQAQGADQAQLILEGVPPTADVLIPDVILEPGGATVRDPKEILIRVPDTTVRKRTPSGKTARIAGYTVPITLAPMNEMTNRREFPDPGGFRPVATVR